jgi:transposase
MPHSVFKPELRSRAAPTGPPLSRGITLFVVMWSGLSPARIGPNPRGPRADFGWTVTSETRIGGCLDWVSRYRNRGFEALAPKARRDGGQSRTITPQLANLIERLERENPHRTGTTLLPELALSSGQNEPAISASTLYRFLKQRGLSEKQLLAPQPRRSSKPSRVTRSGRPTCFMAAYYRFGAPGPAKYSPCCTASWMMLTQVRLTNLG